MTIAFFAISGLDMINAVETLDKDKKEIIKWIYSLQVLPNQSGQELDIYVRNNILLVVNLVTKN